MGLWVLGFRSPFQLRAPVNPSLREKEEGSPGSIPGEAPQAPRHSQRAGLENLGIAQSVFLTGQE